MAIVVVSNHNINISGLLMLSYQEGLLLSSIVAVFLAFILFLLEYSPIGKWLFLFYVGYKATILIKPFVFSFFKIFFL